MTVKYKTLSHWPQYNMSTQHFLSFRNKVDRVQQYMFAREINFWRSIVPGVMDLATRSYEPPVVNVVYENDTDTRDPEEVYADDDFVSGHTEL